MENKVAGCMLHDAACKLGFCWGRFIQQPWKWLGLCSRLLTVLTGLFSRILVRICQHVPLQRHRWSPAISRAASGHTKQPPMSTCDWASSPLAKWKKLPESQLWLVVGRLLRKNRIGGTRNGWWTLMNHPNVLDNQHVLWIRNTTEICPLFSVCRDYHRRNTGDRVVSRAVRICFGELQRVKHGI